MNIIAPWSESDLEFLKTNYPLISNAKIAKHLNRTPSAIATKAFRMKLERPARKNAGQFKPAHTRTKTVQLNSIIEISSAGYPVILIKTEQGWLKAHRVIWERNNGPIPAGYSVGFKDGNSRNVEINNLICMPKGEIRKYHSKLPKENKIKIARKPRLGGTIEEPKKLSIVAQTMLELKSSGLIRVIDTERKCEFWLTPEQKVKYDEKQRQKELALTIANNNQKDVK